MKNLLVHNKYQQKGGEDSVLQDEKVLLDSKGNKVDMFFKDNEEIKSYNIFQKVKFPFSMLFSFKSLNEIKRKCQTENPDIIHVHNFFPLISPSVFFVSKKIPIVMTVHNYRLLCPGAYFLRDKKPCELCLKNKSFKYAIKHKCYRNSRVLNILMYLMLNIHQRTFRMRISKLIVLTSFMKEKFLEAGYDEKQIVVKPNFINNPPKPVFKKKEFTMYLGRLSEEKGFQVLADAWKDMDFSLKVFGDGELNKLKAKKMKLFGTQPLKKCLAELKNAKFLILPSILYECFPRTIIEAFSVGTPVLASNLGNMKHIIKDGETGLLFNPGDPEDLRKKAQYLIDNPKECERMGKNAYEEYKKKYTADINYKQLMKIYKQAIKEKQEELRK